LDGLISGDGQHAVLITAADITGNMTRQTQNVRKDSVPLELTLTPRWESPAVYTQSKTFDINVGGSAPSGVRSMTVGYNGRNYNITGYASTRQRPAAKPSYTR
jgi:hypothetical protein